MAFKNLPRYLQTRACLILIHRFISSKAEMCVVLGLNWLKTQKQISYLVLHVVSIDPEKIPTLTDSQQSHIIVPFVLNPILKNALCAYKTMVYFT